MNERKSVAPTFPDAEYVGQHLIIHKTEWVPGGNPEPHLREDCQTTYPERYLRCIRCGAERHRRSDFPEVCDALPAVDTDSGASVQEGSD